MSLIMPTSLSFPIYPHYFINPKPHYLPLRSMIKHLITKPLFLIFSEPQMTLEDPEPNPISDHILDWLEGSLSFFPSFLEDPYCSGDFNADQWCIEGLDLDQELITTSSVSINTDSTIASSALTESITPNPPLSQELSKKRKAHCEEVPNTTLPQNFRKNQNHKRSSGAKRTGAKAAGNNSHNGNNKEGRWAEQLLNPCATAITAGNLTRVQHLLCVLRELASPSGDANHRLADHGLRALTHHLSSSSSSFSMSERVITFASTTPQFFQKSLLKFYDSSPWFIFHNTIANASILQFLSDNDRSRNLHLLDIGVSHGAQWPTLLESLTRLSGGPPPLVRLTVIAGDQTTDTPFAIGPPGDNYSSRLLFFAKSMNINLEINRIDNYPLQNLSSQIINSSPDETLIVCTQFRLHHLNHTAPDNRTEFLRVLRNLEPKGVILSENNMDCSCNDCGDFALGFSRRVDFLWKFLDSTSLAFKGRESDERRVMEGEATKALTNLGENNERKEKWCERMREVGFAGEAFGEDAIDAARALMRKYDSNWEMKAEEEDACVGLGWKGQPVSFCSLWKIAANSNYS